MPKQMVLAASKRSRGWWYRDRLNGWALGVLPVVILLAILFFFPIADILRRSFTDFQSTQASAYENYKWFFGTPVNVTVLQRTLLTGALVTTVCLLLGYPYAYLMTVVRGPWRLAMIAVVVVPFWTSFIVRNYAWIILLRDHGVVNDLLGKVGLGPVELLGNVRGVMIGMAQILLPFMVLPLYASMRRIDRSLLLAAASLGAKPRIAFLRIYFPLSLPGVLAGSLLVFILALGFYITPAMLGSPQDSLLSQLIVTQVSVLLEWGRGGAMAAALLVATLALLGLAARATRQVTRTLPGEEHQLETNGTV